VRRTDSLIEIGKLFKHSLRQATAAKLSAPLDLHLGLVTGAQLALGVETSGLVRALGCIDPLRFGRLLRRCFLGFPDHFRGSVPRTGDSAEVRKTISGLVDRLPPLGWSSRCAETIDRENLLYGDLHSVSVCRSTLQSDHVVVR